MLHEERANSQAVVDLISGPVYVEPPSVSLREGSITRLTLREREIAAHIAQGMTNGEIASRLFISVNTVKRHMANIYAKTGARNRVQLVRDFYRL